MIYQLYVDAMAIEPEERDTFIRSKCKDKNILEQVLLLLSSDKTEFTLTHQVAQESDLYQQQNTANIGDKISVYQLTENLGQGGMGAVFKAQRIDGRFEQTVAIKVISPLLYRFFDGNALVNEANFMAKLNHNHICSVIDAGGTEEGLHYIVMEYIEGCEISTYFEDVNLPLNEKLKTFSSLCNAVNYAHQMQVIHGDLKPANILINQNKQIKVLDFGISQVINPPFNSLENESEQQFHGVSKGFSSPELINGGKPSVYSDIYALGKILAQLFEKSNQTKHRHGRNYNREINAIINKATALQSTDRYASVSELRKDINLLLGGYVVSAYTSSEFYNFKKFVFNRHPVPFFAGVIFIASLTGLGANLAIQYQNLENEKYQTDLMLEKFSLVLDLDFDKKSNIELSLANNFVSRDENDKASVLFDKVITRFDKLTNTDVAFDAGAKLIKLLIKEDKVDFISSRLLFLKSKLTYIPKSNLPITAAQAMFKHSLINSSYHRGVSANKELFNEHTQLLQSIKQNYWNELNNKEKNRVNYSLRKVFNQDATPKLKDSFYYQKLDISQSSNLIDLVKNTFIEYFPSQSTYSVEENEIRQFIESQAIFWSGTHVDEIESEGVNKATFSQGITKIKDNEGIYEINGNALIFDFGIGPESDYFIYLSSRIALTVLSDIHDLGLLTVVDIISDNKHQPWFKEELTETTWYHIYDRAFYNKEPISPTLMKMKFYPTSVELMRDEQTVIVPWEIDSDGLLNLVFKNSSQETLRIQKVYRDEQVMIIKNNTTGVFSLLFRDKNLAYELFNQWKSFL
jgi:serine/threonine protein kinase